MSASPNKIGADDQSDEIAPDEEFMVLGDVLGIAGLGRTKWTDLVREGDAPQPIKIGTRSLWLKSEVRAWMARKISASRQQEVA